MAVRLFSGTQGNFDLEQALETGRDLRNIEGYVNNLGLSKSKSDQLIRDIYTIGQHIEDGTIDRRLDGGFSYVNASNIPDTKTIGYASRYWGLVLSSIGPIKKTKASDWSLRDAFTQEIYGGEVPSSYDSWYGLDEDLSSTVHRQEKLAQILQKQRDRMTENGEAYYEDYEDYIAKLDNAINYLQDSNTTLEDIQVLEALGFGDYARKLLATQEQDKLGYRNDEDEEDKQEPNFEDQMQALREVMRAAGKSEDEIEREIKLRIAKKRALEAGLSEDEINKFNLNPEDAKKKTEKTQKDQENSAYVLNFENKGNGNSILNELLSVSERRQLYIKAAILDQYNKLGLKYMTNNDWADVVQAVLQYQINSGILQPVKGKQLFTLTPVTLSQFPGMDIYKVEDFSRNKDVYYNVTTEQLIETPKKKKTNPLKALKGGSLQKEVKKYATGNSFDDPPTPADSAHYTDNSVLHELPDSLQRLGTLPLPDDKISDTVANEKKKQDQNVTNNETTPTTKRFHVGRFWNDMSGTNALRQLSTAGNTAKIGTSLFSGNLANWMITNPRTNTVVDIGLDAPMIGADIYDAFSGDFDTGDIAYHGIMDGVMLGLDWYGGGQFSNGIKYLKALVNNRRVAQALKGSLDELKALKEAGKLSEKEFKWLENILKDDKIVRDIEITIPPKQSAILRDPNIRLTSAQQMEELQKLAKAAPAIKITTKDGKTYIFGTKKWQQAVSEYTKQDLGAQIKAAEAAGNKDEVDRLTELFKKNETELKAIVDENAKKLSIWKKIGYQGADVAGMAALEATVNQLTSDSTDNKGVGWVGNFMTNLVTMSPFGLYRKGTRDFGNRHIYTPQQSPSPQPPPIPKPQPKLIEGRPQQLLGVKPKPEPTPNPQPNPQPKPNPQPEPQPAPQPRPQPVKQPKQLEVLPGKLTTTPRYRFTMSGRSEKLKSDLGGNRMKVYFEYTGDNGRRYEIFPVFRGNTRHFIVRDVATNQQYAISSDQVPGIRPENIQQFSYDFYRFYNNPIQ